MSRPVVLDTHVLAWSMIAPDMISRRAASATFDASETLVSAISLFEIGIKVRAGKWAAMAPYASDLEAYTTDQGMRLVSLSPEICTKAAFLQWDHRDPFDRLIASTATIESADLVTRDTALHSFPDIQCIW